MAGGQLHAAALPVGFQPVEVPTYSQSLLAITPYVSGVHDNVHGRRQLQGGADMFWKPNGQTQLTAALNPDFGQVESDDLVVNFGATETLCQRQAAVLHREPGHLRFQPARRQQPADLHASGRRTGRRRQRRGDINAAVKLNGSVGTTRYGVLAADENGEAGRIFGALRLTHDFGTRAWASADPRGRPCLDREATVLGVDHTGGRTPK